MTYFSRKSFRENEDIEYDEDRTKSFIKQVAHINNANMDMKILNTKIEENVYLNIVDNIVKEDYQYKLDSKRNFLQIRVILQGEFEKLNPNSNQKTVYEENHIVIEYKEDRENLLVNKKGEHLKYLCISLEENFLKENDYLYDIFRQQMNKQASINIFEPELKKRYSELFEREYTSKIDKIYLKNKTMDMIFFVIEKLQNSTQKSLSIDEEDIKRVRKAKTIIEESYGEKITIPLLAKKVALNESKLKKGFKELFNATIREYLVEIRLQKALEYLQTQQYSVKEVTQMVGYTNQGSFAFAFAKQYNCTPKELLKKK